MNTVNFASKYRRLWPLALGAFVLAGTACEALATQGARDVVETGRQVQALEVSEVAPLEDELRTLIEEEIQPVQDELEDLYLKEREIEDTVIRPLENSQQDPFSPGGEAFALQKEYAAKFQEIDKQYREIDIEERRLQRQFQNGPAAPVLPPEIRAGEDELHKLQRELDRLYRFGNRPIEKIYDQINFLSASVNWSDPDTDTRVNEINRRINDLYQQANEAQINGSGITAGPDNGLSEIDNRLNILYTEGRKPIDDLYRQIDEEQLRLSESDAASFATNNEIAELNSRREFLVGERERVLSQLSESRIATVAEIEATLAAVDAEIAAVKADISAAEAAAAPDPAIAEQEASLAALKLELAGENEAISAIVADAVTQIRALELQVTAADDGTASSTDAVLALKSQIADVETARDAATTPHQARASEIDAEIAVIEASLAETSALSLQDESAASLEALQGDLAVLLDKREIVVGPLNDKLAGIDSDVAQESAFWQDQIDLVDADIAALSESVGNPAAVDDSFLRSLVAQVDVLESEYQAEMDRLEGSRSGLQAQGNTFVAADPAQPIYDEIDRLNGILFQIADGSGAAVQDKYHQIELLQRKAFDMEQQLKDRTRAMEERGFALEGELQELYRSNTGDMLDPQAEMNAAFQALQDRRDEIDNQRYALESEANDVFSQFEGGNGDVDQKVREAEKELLEPVRIRIRELEIQLKDLRREARDLEKRIRVARRSVSDQRRNLENDVLNLLDTVVGASESLSGSDLPAGAGPDGIPADEPQFDPQPDAVDEGLAAPETEAEVEDEPRFDPQPDAGDETPSGTDAGVDGGPAPEVEDDAAAAPAASGE